MASAQKGCITRLQREYKSLLRDPVPHIEAHPSPGNILEWHYVLLGTPGTDFEGGVYWGRLTFPPTYPFKPPSISMCTPNGRFAINTKLCLSMTDFHPESWNPLWSVGSILTGLLSFMYDSAPTTGSISSSRSERQRLAAASLSHNVGCAAFRRVFPGWVEEHTKREAAAAATKAAAVAAAQTQQQSKQQQQQQGKQQQQQVGGGQANGRGTQQQQQQQQQQRQNGVAGGGGLLTAAVVVALLAVATVPLLSTDSDMSSRLRQLIAAWASG